MNNYVHRNADDMQRFADQLEDAITSIYEQTEMLKRKIDSASVELKDINSLNAARRLLELIKTIQKSLPIAEDAHGRLVKSIGIMRHRPKY